MVNDDLTLERVAVTARKAAAVPIERKSRPTAIALARAAQARAEAEGAQLLEAMHAAERRFRAAFELAPTGVALLSALDGRDPRYAEVNRALCRILGCERDDIVGRRLGGFTHPEDRPDVDSHFSRLLAGHADRTGGEIRLVQATGGVRYVRVEASLLERDTIVMQVQDVTEHRQSQLALEHMASHDPLTGLYNRRRFQEELEHTLAGVRRHEDSGALAIIDIDNFKRFNDAYSLAAGDELLRLLAHALEARLRATDVVARLGDDEFGVILSRTEPEAATQVVQALLDDLRGVAVVVDARAVRATVSAGLRPFGARDLRPASVILGEAQLAMHEAKEQGRDRLSVARPDAGPNPARTQMRWSERIGHALQDDGFVLYEQPILSLGESRLDRSELLIRMLDDGEPITPRHFLPAAERYGQMRAIDRWVIGRAIGLLAERRAQGVEFGVGVNLSGDSLSDEEFMDHLASEIANARIDATAITFEITETVAVGNLEQVRRLASRLTDLGCSLALDDFGAGFSSFAYLRHLPLDLIKIDGQFIRGLPTSRDDQLTVRAIVELAHGLGKRTVAEFVQDEQTIDLLEGLGVDFAQGCHVGDPQPAAVSPRWLRCA